MSLDELPSIDEIYANHDEIVERFELDNPGVDDYFPDRKLQDVLDEARQYDDVYVRAAILLRELASAHIFADGNKRTAFLTAVEYLDRFEIEPAELHPEDIQRVIKSLSRFDATEISTWLQTGQIDENRLN
ncbi:Fic family protein [Haloferax larsenii]|uniref:Fic family protein n=1 Tax=Haloferax larsenii TaxID=302484 RepID=UPI0009447C7C|nr:Fic family protein [Haloferax larsenii]